ncbi:unnamed protein product, partial [Mesorhabditis spiculigera]
MQNELEMLRMLTRSYLNYGLAFMIMKVRHRPTPVCGGTNWIGNIVTGRQINLTIRRMMSNAPSTEEWTTDQNQTGETDETEPTIDDFELQNQFDDIRTEYNLQVHDIAHSLDSLRHHTLARRALKSHNATTTNNVWVKHNLQVYNVGSDYNIQVHDITHWLHRHGRHNVTTTNNVWFKHNLQVYNVGSDYNIQVHDITHWLHRHGRHNVTTTNNIWFKHNLQVYNVGTDYNIQVHEITHWLHRHGRLYDRRDRRNGVDPANVKTTNNVWFKHNLQVYNVGTDYNIQIHDITHWLHRHGRLYDRRDRRNGVVRAG